MKRRCRVKRPGQARANPLRHWRRHYAKAAALLLLALAALGTPASADPRREGIALGH